MQVQADPRARRHAPRRQLRGNRRRTRGQARVAVTLACPAQRHGIRLFGEYLRQVRTQQWHAEVVLHHRHCCTSIANLANSPRC
ncbi:hypothetical protein [Pseudomonas anguilliseptica]|uniref:hypothetical protein n=1 Tax=Pseudomonas anguilliseptica TaxID=53406 RepID=UPI0023EA4C56|nr:hypothetical protein [Pseudomonas anguilliseptica]